MSIHRDAEAFTGTERFQVRRRLGAGAFGVVYEAWDWQESAPVALKVLRFAEADALYRFKRGIRSLSDIRHPNLVEFHGLESVNGWWFLSMELIQGVDFIEHLRGISWNDLAGTSSSTPGNGRDEDEELLAAVEDDGGVRVDYGAVRAAVAQLGRGLHTLHQNGRLHRDIKPPNVMIDGDGRVVLLDFGLVTELERWDMLESADTTMVGTPAYMAPEQAEGGPGLPASDWYSVGVMLYQALTGTLPFTGTLFEIVRRKLTQPVPEMRHLAPGVPRDLEELCRGLLAPEPEERLGGAEVLERLAAAAPSPPAAVHAPVSPSSPFVGRKRALAELEKAFDDSRRGAVSVYVSGPSGMGKTALVHHFLARIPKRDDVVVLPGRCYLQESVPYKALDSLIDALSRYLTSLPRHEAEVLLPANAVTLARLFPVLRRVPAVEEARVRVHEDSDPQGLRRRAFLALRELLARLAERRTLVLTIDDLQWGDVDSFHLLDDLLRPPDPPPLLMIGCYRSEDQGTSPFLRALEKHRKTLRQRGGEVRDVVIEDLPEDDAQELVLRLRAEGAGLDEEQVAAIVREGGGSPLLLAELARYARERGGVPAFSPLGSPPGTAAAGTLTLHEVIRARVAQLTDAPRRLLEVVAVAGIPLDLTVAGEAAEISSGVGPAVEHLHAARLLRRSVGEEKNEVETYHDRIREAVVETLSRDLLRSHHRRLAEALEAAGEVDAETLAVHYSATGEGDRARAYAVAAAEQAEATLAFERAARLFRMALDLGELFGQGRYSLQVRLGRALALAGHSREAAETLIGAVENSGTFDPFEVQRDAAEQLLISGHIDRGLLVLRHVLRTVGMSLEERRSRALVDLWWRRLRLRLRGRRFREREEGSCDPMLLKRIDVCWSVEMGLCLVDVLHASHFHARHLLLALRAGEPRRVGRAFAMEVFFGVMEGSDPRPAFTEARRIAARIGDRQIINLAEMAAGMRACVKGDWLEAHRRLVAAEEHLSEEMAAGMIWELDTVKHFRILAMLHLGRWAELFTEMPQLLKRAQVRGDRYLEIHLRQWVECRDHLARDEPAEAAAAVAEAIAGWSHQGFHFQHFGHLVAAVEIALYRGESERALALVEERWPQLKGSMIERLEIVLVLSHDLRARATLAAAAAEPEAPRRGRLLARVVRDAKRVARARSTWAEALASLLLAGAASVRGLEVVAAAQLGKAENGFTAGDMRVLAGVARRRRGQCLEAADNVREADAVLGGQGIRRPDRLADVYAPGNWK